MANQIYAIANALSKNLGYTGSNVIDATSFTAFATDTLSGSKDAVYNAIYKLIGATVVAIDEAEESGRGITVNGMEYGAILRKLSFITQDASASSEWDIANPENPYTVAAKGGIVAKYFEIAMPTFSYTDAAYDYQLREAFHGPEELAGFVDGLYIRQTNAYRRAKLGLEDAAIASLMGTITADTTDANFSRRVRHLVTEYNALYGTTLTSATAYDNADYIDYVRETLITDRKNLNKLTSLYNTVGKSGSEVLIDRRTSEADLKLDVSLGFSKKLGRYYADAYNEEFITLPSFNEVVNWGIATDPAAAKISLDGGTTTTTISNILGLMYDRDAVVCTMDRTRFVSKYDEWNERNVFKLTANPRYMVDPTENAIVYLND